MGGARVEEMSDLRGLPHGELFRLDAGQLEAGGGVGFALPSRNAWAALRRAPWTTAAIRRTVTAPLPASVRSARKSLMWKVRMSVSGILPSCEGLMSLVMYRE